MSGAVNTSRNTSRSSRNSGTSSNSGRSKGGTSGSDDGRMSVVSDPRLSTKLGSGKALIAALASNAASGKALAGRTAGAPDVKASDNARHSSARAGEATIFVKNLDIAVENAELWLFFSQVGKVLWAEVDENTRCSEGLCAVVDFEKARDAQKAVKDFNGKLTEISGAGQLEVTRQIDPNLASVATPDIICTAQSSSSEPEPMSVMNCIYLRNIRRTISHDEIRHLFRPAGNLQYIQVDTVGEAGYPWAVVHFDTAQQARFAMKSFNGEYTTVSTGYSLKMRWGSGYISPVFQIDNIDPGLSASQVSYRLSKVLEPIRFEPNPVVLFQPPGHVGTYSTIARFKDAATAKEAAKRVRTTALGGSKVLTISYLAEDRDLPPKPVRGRVRLERVSETWSQQVVYERVRSATTRLSSGCIINIEKAKAREKLTRSFILTFDSQETADRVVPEIHGQCLGGPRKLEAAIYSLS